MVTGYQVFCKLQGAGEKCEHQKFLSNITEHMKAVGWQNWDSMKIIKKQIFIATLIVYNNVFMLITVHHSSSLMLSSGQAGCHSFHYSSYGIFVYHMLYNSGERRGLFIQRCDKSRNVVFTRYKSYRMSPHCLVYFNPLNNTENKPAA